MNQEDLYTFAQWEEDYLKRKDRLKKLLSKDLGKLVKELEETTELDARIIQELNQMMKKKKYQLRKLSRLGKIFPLDIQDFPLEMMLFDHVNHQEEMAEVHYVLSQISRYTANKENLNSKQMVQWVIYIIKCTADIVLE